MTDRLPRFTLLALLIAMSIAVSASAQQLETPGPVNGGLHFFFAQQPDGTMVVGSRSSQWNGNLLHSLNETWAREGGVHSTSSYLWGQHVMQDNVMIKDTWSVSPNVSLSSGVQWERLDNGSRSQHQLASRLGLKWRKGKTSLHADVSADVYTAPRGMATTAVVEHLDVGIDRWLPWWGLSMSGIYHHDGGLLAIPAQHYLAVRLGKSFPVPVGTFSLFGGLASVPDDPFSPKRSEQLQVTARYTF
jgi:hypothetical protein